MPAPSRVRHRLLAAIAGCLVMGAVTACADASRISPAERRQIADSLSAMVTAAYDFSQPNPTQRLLSLYPDSGRIISAVAGRVTTSRDSLANEIQGFWQRVGQNMQSPRFVLGSTYVDVLTRNAAVMTLVYSIPHTTPRGSSHVVSGAWTMLWRRDQGRWRIVQEHLSDTPESSAPGPVVMPRPMSDSSPASVVTPAHQH